LFNTKHLSSSIVLCSERTSTNPFFAVLFFPAQGPAAARRGGRVVVELECGDSVESQLLIREIVEDSPSMTAFSTVRSALHKAGLFFVVTLDGALTPELASRASLVVD